MKLYTIGYKSDRIDITRDQVATAVREGAHVYELTLRPRGGATFRGVVAGIVNPNPRARSRYSRFLTGEEALNAQAGGEPVEWLTPCADLDEALTRSGAWMQAGSPNHPFSGDPDGHDTEPWCRQCGCGEPGFQHHGGEGAPEPVRSFTDAGEELHGVPDLPRPLPPGVRLWPSPNGVEHAIMDGHCVTCGRTHPANEIKDN